MSHSIKKVQLNDDLIHQWPKTVGFFTHGEHEKLVSDVEKNDNYYVTEKLDGSNMSISTEGYIGSRTKIIATRDEVKTLNGKSLAHPVSLFDAVDNLHDHLKTKYFPSHNFELIVYGEFMYNGTASCKFDKHDYVERGFKPEHFYAFGLGFVFTALNTDLQEYLPRVFTQAFQVKNSTSQSFFVVPIDWALTNLFNTHNILCVNILSCQRLQNFFKKSDRIDPMVDRAIEGYILTSMNGGGMLKLKYHTTKDAFHDNHVALLEAGMPADTFRVLKHIYDAADNYMNTFDVETFTSFYGQVLYNDMENIDAILALPDNHFEVATQILLMADSIQSLMAKHYKKRLDPAIICDIKDRVFKKMKALNKSRQKSKSNVTVI